MNIQEAQNFLNFFINKSLGSYFPPDTLDQIIDRGQLSLYSDLQPKYATSQRIKDALAPFRMTYTFDFPDTLNGIVTVPANLNFLNLLDVKIIFDISAQSFVKQVPIPMLNEDVIPIRQDSQVDPVTVTNPVGEVIGVGQYQLYPKAQYRGVVTFLRRPVKPHFAYTTVSQRVIVYDSANSIQLEWGENFQNAVLLKALETLGINLSAADVTQYAEQKTEGNFMNNNRT